MLVRKVQLPRGVRAKGQRPKALLKLPGALTLTGFGRDGKLGTPSKKIKIVTGRSKTDSATTNLETEIYVGKGKRKDTNACARPERTKQVRIGASGRSFSKSSNKRSRSESNRARPSREGGGHSSTRISKSNPNQLVLPHESAL